MLLNLPFSLEKLILDVNEKNNWVHFDMAWVISPLFIALLISFQDRLRSITSTNKLMMKIVRLTTKFSSIPAKGIGSPKKVLLSVPLFCIIFSQTLSSAILKFSPKLYYEITSHLRHWSFIQQVKHFKSQIKFNSNSVFCLQLRLTFDSENCLEDNTKFAIVFAEMIFIIL